MNGSRLLANPWNGLTRFKSKMPKKVRDDQSQAVIDKGNLWSAFWATAWGRDLLRFIDEQERLGKDATADLVIAGEYEKAKAAGHKTAGIISVKTYINESISDMKDMIESESAPTPPEAEIPSHVRTNTAA